MRRLAGARITHLLIVSGPTGSGKSTFLQQLAGGRLPSDLTRALPPGAPSWPQTNGAVLMGSPLRLEHGSGGGAQLPGLVLHFDILRPFETERTYETDEAMAIASLADRVTAVAISPPAEQLASQIERRTRLRVLTRGFKRLRRRLGLSFHRGRTIRTHLRDEKLAALYRTAGFVDSWNRRWLDFLMDRFADQVTGPVIHVEPALEHGRKTFRLASDKASSGVHPERRPD
jgi:energy-coupling factor transporter ATP-binding protein EcfA2